MSTNHHTAISTSAAANASNINSPLGQIDQALSDFASGTNPFDFTQFSVASTITLDVSGNCSLSGASQFFIVAANSGTADTMVDLTNRPTGGDGWYAFKADTGDTITVQHGTIVTADGNDYVMTGNAVAIIMEIAGTLYLFSSGTAETIGYTPTYTSDWLGTDPTNIKEALDKAAYNFGQGFINGFEVSVTATASTTLIVNQGDSQGDGKNMRIGSNSQFNVDLSTLGALGLDTGTIAADTWYYVFVIVDRDTGTVSALASASQTPTLPSGYDGWRRIGTVRSNGSSQLYRQTMLNEGGGNRWVIYHEDTSTGDFVIYNDQNLSTSPTWDSGDCSAVVPPTALQVKAYVGYDNAGGAATVFYRTYTNQQMTLLQTRTGTAAGISMICELPCQFQSVSFTSSASVDEDFDFQVQGYMDNLIDDINFSS